MTRPSTPTAQVALGSDGILSIDFRNCDRVTLDIIRDAHQQHLALCPDRAVPVMLIGYQVGGVDYDAQRFGSSPSVRRAVSSMALVARSFLERHLARLFLTYHRPPYPVRVFEDEATARAWLAQTSHEA